jgi:formate--tetrahydrofolate ligase
MAIFCLVQTKDELKEKIDNIIVAYNTSNKPIYVKDLGITNAIVKILDLALKPNIVQTLESNMCVVHGGPFANIAHGCNSVIATLTAMNLAEYTITEAGFGSDLGAEKFLDIVCRKTNLVPNCVVLVASTRSLKMHGGVDKDNLKLPNLKALEIGLENLKQHIKNIKSFGIDLIVSITQLDISLKDELEFLADSLKKDNIPCCFNDTFSNGGKGGVELANKVVQMCEQSKKDINFVYEMNDSIKAKIEKICTRCYGAKGVVYSEIANKKIEEYKDLKYFICMAKTPLSLTDDDKKLAITEEFDINVKDIVISNGANFIVVLTGNIVRMPGLPKIPEANKM